MTELVGLVGAFEEALRLMRRRAETSSLEDWPGESELRGLDGWDTPAGALSKGNLAMEEREA